MGRASRHTDPEYNRPAIGWSQEGRRAHWAAVLVHVRHGRIYCIRAEPRVQTAQILDAITCWAKPGLVDLAIHQHFQHLKNTVPTIAREPNRKNLPISAEIPSNPRVALEIFLRLLSLQQEHGQTVDEDHVRGIQNFRDLFTRYGHQEMADGLPTPPQEGVAAGTEAPNAAAPGRSRIVPPTTNQPDPLESLMEEVQEEVLTAVPPTEEPMTDDNLMLSDAATPVRDESGTGISHIEAADIESELNNMLTINDENQSPSMVADPATTHEQAANTSIWEPPQDQSVD